MSKKVLNPQTTHFHQPSPSMPAQPPMGHNPPPQSQSMSSRTSTGGFGGPLGGPLSGPQPGSQGFAGGDPSQSFTQPHNRSFSQGNMLPSQGNQQPQFSVRNSIQPTPRFANGGGMTSQGPPQLGALPFQAPPSSGQQSPPSTSGSQLQSPQLQERRGSGIFVSGQAPPAVSSARTPPPLGHAQGRPPSAGVPQPAPSNPVFGIPLNRLYERDSLAVPMVVYQCIQAVDLFGLGLEGIYRQSGSLTHINRLKNMFDTGMYSTADAPGQSPRLISIQNLQIQLSTLGTQRTSTTTSIVLRAS